MFMRSLVTALALVILASTLAETKSAWAGTVTNVSGKFSFWVPDSWKETKETANAERTTFQSPGGNIFVVAGPLAEKDAELTDDDVADFADEEMDDMKVTSDKSDKLEIFNVRLLEGTGLDEGDPVIFKMLALDPDTDDGVLAVLVYGDPRQMNRAANVTIVDRILRSLRPH